MKPFFKHFAKVTVAFVLVFSWSCERKPDIDAVAPSVERQFVTIEEAKSWLKEHIKTNDIRKYENVLWDLAETTTIQEVPILTIPFFDSNNSSKVQKKQNGIIEEVDISTQRLIFFEDDNGSMQSFILAVDNKDDLSNFNNYSGNFYFKDTRTTDLKAIWNFQKGKLVGINTINKSAANARTGSDCSIEMYILECSGTGQLSGGSGSGDGCRWVLAQTFGCGGGTGTGVGGDGSGGDGGGGIGGFGGGGGGFGGGGLIGGITENSVIGLGRFVMRADVIRKYPRFAKLVKELKSYVENNTEIMSSLSSLTGYSREDILEVLKWNSGPEIKIEDFATEFGKLGTETRRIVGQFKRESDPNSIYINANWVRGLESANLEETRKATAFLLGVAMLHEFVHLGRFKNELPRNLCNNPSDYNCEAGWYFNTAAFGTLITDRNASQYSYIFFR